MNNSNKQTNQREERRQRLHELLIALIHKQDDLELIDPDSPQLDGGNFNSKNVDPASWLDRNRRLLKRYQALVRSAITLDALLDAEQTHSS